MGRQWRKFCLVHLSKEPYPTLRNKENVRICTTCGEIWDFYSKIKNVVVIIVNFPFIQILIFSLSPLRLYHDSVSQILCAIRHPPGPAAILENEKTLGTTMHSERVSSSWLFRYDIGDWSPPLLVIYCTCDYVSPYFRIVDFLLLAATATVFCFVLLTLWR